VINVKIARLTQDGNETYGLIKDGNVATKENMIYQTGVPLPLGIMDFLFEGWYDEIKDKISSTSFQDKLEKFKLLHPLPNPSKIICLTFNYPKHAKEQNYVSTKEPVIFISQELHYAELARRLNVLTLLNSWIMKLSLLL